MFHELIQQNPNLPVPRYLRLCIGAALVYLSLAKLPKYPYRGLGNLHLNFGRIRQYPVENLDDVPNRCVNLRD